MDIKDSYLHGTVGVVKSISVSADKLKYKLADIAGTVKEVTLPVATQTANGLMSSGDKTKLDTLSSTIGNYVTLNTDQEITGTKTFTKQLKFTVALGTAPFLVTSDTKVNNLNADKLDNLDSSDFVRSYGVVGANYKKGNWLGYTYNTTEHGGATAGGVLSFGLEGHGCQLNGYASKSNPLLYYRSYDSEGWSNWKQIVFTDSNITGNAATATHASTADKLKTKRKLWGLDFDGSADVDGQAIMTGSSTDLYWSCKGSKYQIGFGIGNSNINRGIYDFTNNHWWIFKSDKDETYIPDGNVGIGTSSPAERLQVNGNVKATSFIGNLDGTYVNKLTNYSKATAIAALAATDTLNTALGKLEYKADVAYNLVKGAYDGDGTIENLAEILKVLEGIKDTETIKAIIGKYLPLTGGTLNSGTDTPLVILGTDHSWIGFKNSNGTDLGWIGVLNSKQPSFFSDKSYKIWHEGNDGSGSGLDADLLDGVHLAGYGGREGVMRSWKRGTYTTVDLYFGNGNVVVIDPKPTDSTELSANTTIFSLGEFATRNTLLAFLYESDTIKYRRATGEASVTWNPWVTLMHSGNYTNYINSTNFPGLAGVRNVTINGNYLRVNTNGTNADLTIPYAVSANKLNEQYVGDLDGAEANRIFTSGFQAANRPVHHNYATGISLYNSELKFKYLFAIDTYGTAYIRYRNTTDWQKWKQLAFIDSDITGNAATATRLISPYPYTGDESKLILNSTTADALFTNNYSFSAMMRDHKLFNNSWATVWNFSAYNKYGGTLFAIRYDQQPVRAALRTYSQNSKGWGEWRELAFTDSSILNSKYLLTQTEASEAFYTDSYKGYLKWITNNTAAFKFTNGTFLFLADKAVKLTNARTIWGLSFDGTADIANKPLSGVFESLSFSRENWNYICVPKTNGHLAFNIGIAGTDNTKMCILNNGNVGIGTTTPDTTFSVNGNIKVLNNKFVLYTSSASLTVMQRDRGGIRFYPGITDTELMRIDYEAPFGTFLKNGVRIFNTGYVALGNAVAAYPLHVVGEIYSTSGFIKASSSNDYILLGGGGHEDKSTFAKRRNMNDLMHYGNEFTFVSPQYEGEIYMNFRTASNKTDGNITAYRFCDGKGGTLASITLGSFSGSASSLKATTIITSSKFNLSNAEWTNTGYTFANLASGTYAIQVTSGTNLVASGIMSVYKNLEDSAGDEIPLHVYSNAGWRPYLRTYANKLLISSNDATAKERTVTIKIALIL